MPVRKILILVFLFFFIQRFSYAGNDFPHINIIIKNQAQEDPFPGMGNNFSSLTQGIDTVMWNPAGLVKMGVSAINVGLPTPTTTPRFIKSYKVDDFGFDTKSLLEEQTLISTTASISIGFLFTSNPNETEFTTREFTGTLSYATVPTGSSYKQSIMLNDWLAFGIATHGDSGYSVKIAGDLPAQLKIGLDLFNVDNLNDQFSIKNGYLTVIYSPEVGPSINYTSAGPIWQNFLAQNQKLPLSTVINLNTELNVQSSLTLSGAAKWGKFSFGANLTPMNASMNMDETMRLVFNKNDYDLFFYSPNFDAKNQTSIVNWVSDPNLYSNQAGYDKEFVFPVPPGENLAEFRYQGLLSATTARVDLGTLYEYDDNLTFGLVFENINEAAFDFKAHGVNTYINYRALSLDEGTTTTIPDDYAFYKAGAMGIENERRMPLPRRFRIGFTIKKPYLFTADYERLLTPLTVRNNYYSDTTVFGDMTLDNIQFIRLGFETRLFDYPAWLRLGSVIMLKPDLYGDDPLTRETFESLFSLGLLPIKFDLGLRVIQRGIEFGGGFGFSFLSVMSPWSIWFIATPPIIDWSNKDMVSAVAILSPALLNSYNIGNYLNQEYNRLIYFSTYMKLESWQITFQNAFDLGASGRAYNSIASRKDYLNWLKWVSTLTLSLSF